MPTMTKTDEALEVTLNGLQGAEFPMALAQIKSVTGRRYDPKRKVWCLPLDPHVAERVMVTVKPDCDPALLDWVKSERASKQAELVTPLDPDAEVFIPWRDKLRPYQRSFIDWAANHPKVINGDDMGLGKTVQALSAVAEYQIRNPGLDRPKLIACPNSVKGVWAREIEKWLGKDEKYIIVNGSTAKRRHAQIEEGVKNNAWVIVNWEMLRVTKKEVPVGKTGRTKIVEALKEPLLGDTPWIAVIADEAHRAKNRKSQQTKGLFRIKGDMQIALTGTPIANSPDEIWAILKWLFPDEYTSYWRFFDEYVDYYEGAFGKIITGARNPDALRFELSTRLVRRTKDEVLKDLPAKTREIVPITLNPKQRKLYDEAERKMWFEVEQAIKAGDASAARFAKAAAEGGYSAVYTVPNGAARTVRLRQIASTPATLGGEDDSAKLDAAVEIIMDAQPKQFVVFSEFVPTTKILVERLQRRGLNARAYIGELSPAERTEAEDGFQRGEIDVLVGTISAMGEGVTLHAADTAIFIEEHWTPAKNDQATDRLHRIGQKNPVTILVLRADDTVDDGRVGPTNEMKRLIVSSILKTDDLKEVTA